MYKKTASPVVIGGAPRLVRVVLDQVAELFESVRAQILLVHGALMTDDESLHARDTVFCRCRGESKSTDHHSPYDKVHLAQWCRRGSDDRWICSRRGTCRI